MSNQIKKEAFGGGVDNASSGQATDEEIRLINKYTRRALDKSEVYVFSVVLCDNDVDRDGERFTVESLFELEKLFVGKTGIFDHNPTAKNQTARIFACAVESVEGRKTATNDDYFRLKARAYIPKKGNDEIINAIDGGILKEVSVGCAVGKVLCSVCGEKIDLCSHRKGEIYSNKLCCGELCEPYDAYEFSFVAVPAQKNAGVIKSFSKNRKEVKMEEILKKLEGGEGASLDCAECEKLGGYIATLKEAAKDGIFYRESLTSEILKLSAIAEPDISRDTMESITKSMTVVQLKEIKTAFEKKKSKMVSPAVQLYGKEKKDKAVSNGEFKI